MTNLINMNNQPTISSYDFLKDFINPCRVEAGKAEMENGKFTKKIEDEFGDAIKGRKKVDPLETAGGKQAMVTYALNEEQCMQMALREVKAVRKLLLKKMEDLPKHIESLSSVVNTDYAVMSSLEIAELTGKEHRNVLADIDKMLKELELGELTFQSTYTDKSNRQSKCYNLPKRETMILVSGYSIKIRAKIVDRWEELEKTIDAISVSETHEEAVALAKAAKAERNALRIGCKSDNLRIDEIKKQESLGVNGFEHIFLNTRVSMHLFGCAPDTFKKNTGLSMRDYFESISDVENLHKIGRTLERAITLAELGFSKDEIMAKFPANENKYFN